MLTTFRMVNLTEGLSFLLLLFIAMPAKYYWDYPMAVTVMGWIHGVLFIVYLITATKLAQQLSWPDRTANIVLIASMIPFACFVVDRKLLRNVQ